MKIKIPSHGPITIYSDTNTYISIPGDGPIEVIRAPVVSDGAPNYTVTTDAGTNYVMVDTTNYVVTQV